MEYRHGKCSSCGAEYKIPASFQHDAAKCKECGGVVQIGPVQGGAPSAPASPVPARKFAGSRDEAQPAAAAETPQKKGGTLERLKAQRAAEPAAAKPAAKPSTLERLKAERSAQPQKPAAQAGAASGGGAGAGSRPKAAAGATAGARGGSARRSSRRRGKDDDGDEGGRGARRPARRKEGPNMALLGASLVAVIALGITAYFVMIKGDPTQAKETGEETAQGDPNPADNGVETPPADETPDPEEAGGEDGAGDSDPAEGTDPAAEGAGDEDAGEDKPEPKPKKQGDPNSVDLAAIEDFGRVTGTSDEVWDQMVADMELWMDPWAGKKGNDARDRLVELGYRAMPVIMNGFKGLDLSTEEGHSNGNVIQRALTDLAHGINFGWKSYDDEGALYYNKKVVENFCTQWRKAENNVDYWISWTKLDKKDPDLAASLRSEFKDPDELDGGFDLDLDE